VAQGSGTPMLNEYGQPEIILAPAWSGVPVLTTLLDGEYFSQQRRPGVALNDGGACYSVRLKRRPADVAAYVRERISLPDSDWWWMARSGGIEVSLRIGAMLKLGRRRGERETPAP
jgi:hypothetical protein